MHLVLVNQCLGTCPEWNSGFPYLVDDEADVAERRSDARNRGLSGPGQDPTRSSLLHWDDSITHRQPLENAGYDGLTLLGVGWRVRGSMPELTGYLITRMRCAKAVAGQYGSARMTLSRAYGGRSSVESIRRA